MVASLLYYYNFTKSMTSIGFEINPCDLCVSTKVIDGSQMTIFFHLDDCKLSHCKRNVNDCMIKGLCQEYESIFEDGSVEMSVSRGKFHE